MKAAAWVVLFLGAMNFAENARGQETETGEVEAEGELKPFLSSLPLDAAAAKAGKTFDMPPLLKSAKKPLYPMAMLKQGRLGEVLVNMVVDEQGNVAEASVKGSTRVEFEEPALKAARKWKFEPALKDGKPTRVRIYQPIRFAPRGRENWPMPRMTIYYTAEELAAQAEARSISSPPSAKERLQPVYPYALLLEKIEGNAQVSFLVDELGRATEKEVTSPERSEFGAALRAAVDAAEFLPTMKNGAPSQGPLTVFQRFQLRFIPKDDLELVELAKKKPTKIVSPKNLDTPLTPFVRRAPAFPSAVPSVDGSAVVEILVDKEGRARLPRIVSASDPAFGFAAAHAVQFWLFSKPTVKGKPVITKARVPFKFTAYRPTDRAPDAGSAEREIFSSPGATEP